MNSEKYTRIQINDALSAIRRGDLVLLKGDIGYGLFAISEQGIRRMYEVKGRSYNNPCIVIGNVKILQDIAVTSPEIHDWIAQQVSWTTLAVVLPIKPNNLLRSTLPSAVYELTVTNNTVALFLNIGPYLEELISQAYEEKIIVVGSSANLSSQGNLYDFDQLPKSIVEAADFYIDHGQCKYANTEKRATTILNFTNWTVKRRGVNWEKLEPDFFKLRDQLKENEK